MAAGTVSPSRKLKKILSLEEFEPRARKHLPRAVFSMAAGGSESESSIKANRDAYADIAFRPHTLIDVSKRDQKTELFGQTYDSPFGIAPMGATGLFTYRGDLVFARTAAAANIPFVLSGGSTIPMEKIRAEGKTAWFQGYLFAGEQRIGAMVERVTNSGYDVFVVTSDVPISSKRENEIRWGLERPVKITPQIIWDSITHPRWLVGTTAKTLCTDGILYRENYAPHRSGPLISFKKMPRPQDGRDAMSWTDIAFIRKHWKGKLVVKGIMALDDAKRARDAGVDGIVVSNHGGRQLDFAISPLRVLAEIVDAVSPMVVMIDGGIRRGTDVPKALALGAKFVFAGRPFMYAASIAGEEGVAHAISILRNEIDINQALIGETTLAGLNRKLLVPRDLPVAGVSNT